MPTKSIDLEKTWITQRGASNFNSPSTLTVPYGRYQGTVSGRGGTGNAPVASSWTTNYNTAYPVGNRPIATQPATTWTTNYNTVTNFAGFGFGGFGYAGTYPPSSHTYPVYQASSYYVYHVYKRPQYPWTPPGGYGQNGTWTGNQQASGNGCPSPSYNAQNWTYPDDFMGPYQNTQYVVYSCSSAHTTSPGHDFYYTYYNTNYSTNYPVANQPATAWTTNYNTNYNTIYPIANQPIAGYTPGNPGTAASVLGVSLPGGPVDLSGFGGNPGTATPISPTAVNTYNYPGGANYQVAAPTGSQVTVQLA
jgi:hypothetical protein